MSKGKFILFTGLSGAGKTTFANCIIAHASGNGYMTPNHIDGDTFRKQYEDEYGEELGFDPEDRFKNLRLMAKYACELLNENNVIATFIAPYNSVREMIKEIIGADNYHEVFINCPLEICEQRDPKGLYRKARKGEITNFTGIDDVYEIPEKPDLIINTHKKTLEESAEEFFEKFGHLFHSK
jgi:adenylylsulfate kinase